MPVQVGPLLAADHARATSSGEEFDRHHRDRQPASVELDVVGEDNAPRIHDVEEDLLDVLNTPVRLDDPVRLVAKRAKVQPVLGRVLGMAVGPSALGLRVTPGLEVRFRRRSEPALEAEVGRLLAGILAKPRVAVVMGKALFYRPLETGIAAAYDDAGQTLACNMMDDAALEGVQAFIEKRAPGWR